VAGDWRAPDDECANLIAGLRFHSELLLDKMAGLGDSDLQRAMVPSGTTLIGLVKHMTSVHDYYFVECILARPSELPPSSKEWTIQPGESAGRILEGYPPVIDRSCEILASVPDLGATVPAGGFAGRFNIRATALHVIAEATRHNGHADILRELIDGSAGFR